MKHVLKALRMADDLRMRISTLDGKVADLRAAIKNVPTSKTKRATPYLSIERRRVHSIDTVPPVIQSIITFVCRARCFAVEEVFSQSRITELATTRWIIMLFISDHVERQERIAEYLNKTHGTIHYGLEQVRERIKSDPKFAASVDSLRKKLETILAQTT